jgi:cation:H+ antiporter
MVITVRQGMKNPDSVEAEEEEEESKPKALWLELVLLIGGAALIAVGADLLVNHGTFIAQSLGVPETVIALTFVALGTSLPELVTTITSLRKGHASLGIGNVIGANIFNLVLVSGISVTLAPFDVPVGNTLFGINSSLILDIPVMLAVMLLLTVPALLKKKLGRWQGIVLLGIYAAFCVFQFAM